MWFMPYSAQNAVWCMLARQVKGWGIGSPNTSGQLGITMDNLWLDILIPRITIHTIPAWKFADWLSALEQQQHVSTWRRDWFTSWELCIHMVLTPVMMWGYIKNISVNVWWLASTLLILTPCKFESVCILVGKFVFRRLTMVRTVCYFFWVQ